MLDLSHVIVPASKSSKLTFPANWGAGDRIRFESISEMADEDEKYQAFLSACYCRGSQCAKQTLSFNVFSASLLTLAKELNIPLTLEEIESEMRRAFNNSRKNFSDIGNAEMMVQLKKRELLYRRGSWYTFSKTTQRWSAYDGLPIQHAIDVVKYMKENAEKLAFGEDEDEFVKYTDKLSNFAKLKAMIEVARPYLQDESEWKIDSDSLPVENGIINLKTGKIRPTNWEDKIECYSPVSYDESAQCPRWERFISEIMNDDPQMISYLRLALGYSLTGHTKEQKFFICIGEGSNGKSVLLSTMFKVLGMDFSTPADPKLFIKSADKHEENMAALDRKRLVTASEVPVNAKLNDSVLKSWVHGDIQTARHLRQSRFQFTPQAKIWFAVNNLPEVRDQSDGIWRSIVAIPFKRKFDVNLEPDLEVTLSTELPGILNWLIDAAKDWYVSGLGSTPEAVREETTEYKLENQPVQEFINEKCKIDEHAEIQASILWDAYKIFAENNGISPGTAASFYKQMVKQFRRVKTRDFAKYVGVTLDRGNYNSEV
jgi:putative DNA primase/helicase